MVSSIVTVNGIGLPLIPVNCNLLVGRRGVAPGSFVCK